jgi:hypothetical protein
MEAARVMIPANENARSIRLVLDVTDPDTTHELEHRAEGPEREVFAVQALRIGVLALRQASGALDAQSIQREGERMLGGVREVLTKHASEMTSGVARLLSNYLDPASGSLPQRLESLVKRDGELEGLLAKHLDGDRSTIAQTLARKVGEDSALFKLLSPASAEGVVATLSRVVDETVRGQREEILRQFSLDRPESALSRLVRDIAGANGKLRGELAAEVAAVSSSLSLDNADGPLGRFVARVEESQRSILEQFSLDCEGSAIRLSGMLDAFAESNARFQSDVRAKLEAFRVRREEAARSSAHGHTFEYAVEELLQREAARTGDVCERLAGTPGKEGRKVGDYVLTLGPESAAPGAHIVCECKADQAYTEAKALREIALARKNRDAQMGVFILARESAPEGFEPFRRVGSDLLVVWDAEDTATDVYLHAAISVARALVVREHVSSGRAEADLREIEQSVRAIERLVTTVDSIAHDAQLVVKRGTKIGKAAAGMRERLVDEVERLRGVVEGMQGEEGAAD